jgi:FAD/FMN-containing dehydrogenase
LAKEQFFTFCEQVDHKVFALVSSFGGSNSAEHGVGLLKKPFLSYTRSEPELSLMRQIKLAFDPNNILNPGKIFDLVQGDAKNLA